MRDLFATPEKQPENKGKGKDEAKERAEDSIEKMEIVRNTLNDFIEHLKKQYKNETI